MQLILEAKELSFKEKKENFGKMTKSLNKGAFTEYCNKAGFDKGSDPKCIQKALDEAGDKKDPDSIRLRKQAVLARTFSGMAKRKKEMKVDKKEIVQGVKKKNYEKYDIIDKEKGHNPALTKECRELGHNRVCAGCIRDLKRKYKDTNKMPEILKAETINKDFSKGK